jgi:hypothetical protein
MPDVGLSLPNPYAEQRRSGTQLTACDMDRRITLRPDERRFTGVDNHMI